MGRIIAGFAPVPILIFWIIISLIIILKKENDCVDVDYQSPHITAKQEFRKNYGLYNRIVLSVGKKFYFTIFFFLFSFFSFVLCIYILHKILREEEIFASRKGRD